jgi:hypothetical protein
VVDFDDAVKPAPILQKDLGESSTACGADRLLASLADCFCKRIFRGCMHPAVVVEVFQLSPFLLGRHPELYSSSFPHQLYLPRALLYSG